MMITPRLFVSFLYNVFEGIATGNLMRQVFQFLWNIHERDNHQTIEWFVLKNV